ncbi:MAG TPA: LacI family DNA-binding transcriptional regulator [Chloroflexota bacterium]|nr:LacI family DNA-binding transcriptional regulator [Chloroflexota bacterium]
MSDGNPSRSGPTIRDIARHARVSAATVSRVLNGHDTVHPNLRDQVLRSLSALGYYPNGVARSLRTRQTQTVGVIIPDILNPHFAEAVRAIQDTLAVAGYTPLLCNSDRDRGREFADVAALLARGVDGLILASAAEHASEIAACVRGHRPVVLMDRNLPDSPFDSVSVDCQTPTRDAVLHLVERGRRRIAHLAGPQETSTAREKLAGYREGLEQAGLPFDPPLVCFGDYTTSQGEAASELLLDRRPPPDAVICANNLMSQGLLRAIARRGLAVPTDVAVIATDDVYWTVLIDPPLTVIAQPVYELGQRAATLLLDRLRGESGPPRCMRLQARLLIREST